MVTLKITNDQTFPVEIGMRIEDMTVEPDKGAEVFGHWLLLISAPIFGLGVWLIVARNNGKDANQIPTT